jgi:hypothetical protein
VTVALSQVEKGSTDGASGDPHEHHWLRLDETGEWVLLQVRGSE